jgi:hypothetical protein
MLLLFFPFFRLFLEACLLSKAPQIFVLLTSVPPNRYPARAKVILTGEKAARAMRNEVRIPQRYISSSIGLKPGRVPVPAQRLVNGSRLVTIACQISTATIPDINT